MEKLTEFDKWEKLEKKEIFGRIGNNWRNGKNLETREELKKIDRIWNLDFVSLNRPGTR